MKIEIGTYRTRDGRKAEVDAIGAGGRLAWGWVHSECTPGRTDAHSWSLLEGGRLCHLTGGRFHDEPTEADLIEPWAPRGEVMIMGSTTCPICYMDVTNRPVGAGHLDRCPNNYAAKPDQVIITELEAAHDTSWLPVAIGAIFFILAGMAILHTKIHQHVAAGSTLHTDEAGVYRGLGGLFFNHETVNHSEGEYVRDDVTTNGVESVFAVMKRGLIGVYHHASKKHLSRYVDEFAFRLNDGNVQRHTLDRLDSFVTGTAGKRLTYKALIQ